jgi:hypothetical protein
MAVKSKSIGITFLKRVTKFSIVSILIALSLSIKPIYEFSYLFVFITSFLVSFFFHQKPLIAFLSGIAAFSCYIFFFNKGNFYHFIAEGFSIQILLNEVNSALFYDYFKFEFLSGIAVLCSSLLRYSVIARYFTNWCFKIIDFFCIMIPVLIAVIISRNRKHKKIDIGLGPEPLINNIYHKKALTMFGYTAETFVESVYFITSEFDYRGDQAPISRMRFFNRYSNAALFIRSILRYKCLYIYFNGASLRNYPMIKKLEPKLLRLAKVKVVVMPYGGDVNDMHFGPNYKFKHALCTDYPQFYKLNKNTTEQINRWIQESDFVISGCDWVDYTYHWDQLMLAHFSIDVDRVSAGTKTPKVIRREFTVSEPLKIFHAPNHKTIKGSSFIQKAVHDLHEEGYPIELMLIQKRPNSEILLEIEKADIVADQLVIGWYAMFALEGLSMSKPVICYLREDLIDLYVFAGVLESRDELPFLNADTVTIKQKLKDVLEGRIDLNELSKKGLPYVRKYHSIEAVGKVFDNINKSININPLFVPE